MSASIAYDVIVSIEKLHVKNASKRIIFKVHVSNLQASFYAPIILQCTQLCALRSVVEYILMKQVVLENG